MIQSMNRCGVFFINNFFLFVRSFVRSFIRLIEKLLKETCRRCPRHVFSTFDKICLIRMSY